MRLVHLPAHGASIAVVRLETYNWGYIVTKKCTITLDVILPEPETEV